MRCDVNSQYQIQQRHCTNQLGCHKYEIPDFQLKRHDTQPKFEIEVTDCGTPIDLTNCVCEVSIWAKAKLKYDLGINDTYFQVADNVGFNQCTIGDIILVDRVRSPEQMLVVGFDEENYLILVQRGYHGTIISPLKRGTKLRIFRTLNATGLTEMTFQDIVQVDGTTQPNVLTESKLAYEWSPNDTCLPGCFYIEFKLLQMEPPASSMSFAFYTPSIMPSVTPSFISYTPSQMDCSIGTGVLNVRRFPSSQEGFKLAIVESFTSESLYN